MECYNYLTAVVRQNHLGALLPQLIVWTVPKSVFERKEEEAKGKGARGAK